MSQHETDNVASNSNSRTPGKHNGCLCALPFQSFFVNSPASQRTAMALLRRPPV